MHACVYRAEARFTNTILMRGQSAMLRWRWQIQRSHVINLVASPALVCVCVYTALLDRPISDRPRTVRGIYSYVRYNVCVSIYIYILLWSKYINPTYNDNKRIGARLYRDFSGTYADFETNILHAIPHVSARVIPPRGA